MLLLHVFLELLGENQVEVVLASLHDVVDGGQLRALVLCATELVLQVVVLTVRTRWDYKQAAGN